MNECMYCMYVILQSCNTEWMIWIVLMHPYSELYKCPCIDSFMRVLDETQRWIILAAYHFLQVKSFTWPNSKEFVRSLVKVDISYTVFVFVLTWSFVAYPTGFPSVFNPKFYLNLSPIKRFVCTAWNFEIDFISCKYERLVEGHVSNCKKCAPLKSSRNTWDCT